jgi:hypothetical protein
VVVLDPDIAKEYLDKVQGRSKEKQYAFDMAFDYTNSNEVSPHIRKLSERRKPREARKLSNPAAVSLWGGQWCTKQAGV